MIPVRTLNKTVPMGQSNEKMVIKHLRINKRNLEF